jgi:hypothetical protein
LVVVEPAFQQLLGFGGVVDGEGELLGGEAVLQRVEFGCVFPLFGLRPGRVAGVGLVDG